MNITKLFTAVALLMGLGVAQAGGAYEPALQSFEALSKTKEQNFKGLKEADIKRLREDFSSKAQAAKSAAKAEYAALSQGKTDQQLDKLLRDRADKAGVSAKVKAEIDAMGGPAKLMQQTDRVTAEFVQEVLNGSRLASQQSFAETVVTAMVMAQPAHAAWGFVRRNACYAFWYTISVGYATDHAYTSCDH